MDKTITVSEEVWSKLTLIKLKTKQKTISQTIDYLIKNVNETKK